MVEERIHKADKTEFTECWKTSWRTPYIMRLALSAGIGGLLFGYDTGVISGALLYIKEEYPEVDRSASLQETIVSMAVAGAIFGAALGGWMNDRFGRKRCILVADVLFFIGSMIMACAQGPWMIIIGRVVVGLGIGMASMTAPLYISESSPAKIRGALVSTNGLLITGGQFLAYLVNLAFTNVKGTWRWMLGVAGVPPIVQLALMLFLPESPRWLYQKGRVEEAKAIIEKIYPVEEVEAEMTALHRSVESEREIEEAIGDNVVQRVKGALKDTVVRRGLYAGITVQVAQQFSGINTVMYYSPMIVQFAGFASKKTALALSLITSGLNAIGSIVSIGFVDRYGRRRLMIISMCGIISCLFVLSAVFYGASRTAPKVDFVGSTQFAPNATCSQYASAANPSAWNCMNCLKFQCGFCSNPRSQSAPGACLASTENIRSTCRAQHRTWYKDGCPCKVGFLAVIFLGLYIIAYSPGMGTVPWIINSEIYPLRYRGVGGGMAAVANWVSNLIVSQSFLTMTKSLGSSGTFLVFAAFCIIGLGFIYWFVPETKGMQFEEVEKLLANGFRPNAFRKKPKNNPEGV